MLQLRHVVCAGLSFGLGLYVNAGSLEQFDYGAGALAGQSGGSGWANAWADVFSRNGGDWTVAAPGLEHANLTGEAGNAAFSPSDGSRMERQLDQSYSSGTVYVSFLMQMSDPTVGNPFTALELLSAPGGDGNRVLSVGALRSDDGSAGTNDGFAVRIQDAPGGGTQDVGFLTTSFNTDVNLYVLAFDLDSDTLETFINPDDSTDFSGVGDASSTLFAGFSFDTVSIANFVGPNPTAIDEIRVDTTAPTLVPEPTSLALLGLGGLLIARRRRD